MNTPPAKLSLKILVVEDHPDTLLTLQHYLNSRGHQVFTARSVKEALEKIPSTSIEVFISDIGLPDGTGWELLQKAQFPREVFAVAMSGFGMTADSERSYQVGFQRHLLKPFKAMEIDRILEEAAQAILR